MKREDQRTQPPKSKSQAQWQIDNIGKYLAVIRLKLYFCAAIIHIQFINIAPFPGSSTSLGHLSRAVLSYSTFTEY